MIGIYNDSSSTSFTVYTYGEMMMERGPYFSWSPSNIRFSMSYAYGSGQGATVYSTEYSGGYRSLNEFPPYAHIFGSFTTLTTNLLSTPPFVHGDVVRGMFSAFGDYGKLTTINLPFCSYVGDYTFYQERNLSSVSLPVCEYIGSQAFYSCSVRLMSISLPVCSFIGHSAFQNCSMLNTITLNYPGVVTLENGRSVFAGCDYFNGGTASIYVPSSLVSAYRSAYGWNWFYSGMIKPIPE